MKYQYFKLKPADHHKSFYGKCMVEEINGVMYLWSYSTRVAKIDRSGAFSRLWGGYSDTTKRHVNAFRAFAGLPELNKKEWEALPVCK